MVVQPTFTFPIAASLIFRLTVTNTSGLKNTDSVNIVIASASTQYVSKDGTCGGKTPCFTSIQTAIDAADTGIVINIKIAQETYSESITLNVSKTLTLQGGWDSSFTSPNCQYNLHKGAKGDTGVSYVANGNRRQKRRPTHPTNLLVLLTIQNSLLFLREESC
jgi:pectin methylesterase-like acyl-CoA thioesterase